ncbi:hypothetical protein B0T11DRAFT_331149 [Plectosphaerella cucumerina]|uniref:Uncharacterized protein n=1 Tax=Plectosphaerella cucumerina TaxID=40658 RepID=A0A8K0X3G7_9PEZI|nr:hypothetical protein B0T11DRAFT_331149 [Plectosphaerella cucumerina]
MELGLSRPSDDDDSLLQDSDDGAESVVDTGRCLRDSVHEPSSPVLSTICAGESPGLVDLTTDGTDEPTSEPAPAVGDIIATISALRPDDRLDSRHLYWCLQNALRVRSRKGWCVLEPGFPTSDGQLGTAVFNLPKRPNNIIFLLHHATQHWSVVHWDREAQRLRHYDSVRDDGRHGVVEKLLESFTTRHSSTSPRLEFVAEPCPHGIFALAYIDRLTLGGAVHGLVDPAKLRQVYTGKLEAHVHDDMLAPAPPRNVRCQTPPCGPDVADSILERPAKRSDVGERQTSTVRRKASRLPMPSNYPVLGTKPSHASPLPGLISDHSTTT